MTTTTSEVIGLLKILAKTAERFNNINLQPYVMKVGATKVMRWNDSMRKLFPVLRVGLADQQRLAVFKFEVLGNGESLRVRKLNKIFDLG